jgi:hypothetical protein
MISNWITAAIMLLLLFPLYQKGAPTYALVFYAALISALFAVNARLLRIETALREQGVEVRGRKSKADKPDE